MLSEGLTNDFRIRTEADSNFKDVGTELAKAFKKLSVSIASSELEDFFNFDDENSDEYVAAVLENVDELWRR